MTAGRRCEPGGFPSDGLHTGSCRGPRVRRLRPQDPRRTAAPGGFGGRTGRRPRHGVCARDLRRRALGGDDDRAQGGDHFALGAGRRQLSLYSLVKSLADNKQLLGMRYAEWCIAAPSLEADIAAAAMGLDDIGHSRVLYGSLRELGTPDVQTGEATYGNVPFLDRTWSDWSQFVAANAVLDTAFSLMIEALANGNVEVLRSRLKKMLQEERYHAMHGHSWMREVDAREAVARAWQESLEWFGPEDQEVDELQRQGKLAYGVRDLRRLLAERAESRPPQAGIDWAKWDPVRRRTAPGGIDQATRDMLQGLAEKRYMPAGSG